MWSLPGFFELSELSTFYLQEKPWNVALWLCLAVTLCFYELASPLTLICNLPLAALWNDKCELGNTASLSTGTLFPSTPSPRHSLCICVGWGCLAKATPALVPTSSSKHNSLWAGSQQGFCSTHSLCNSFTPWLRFLWSYYVPAAFFTLSAYKAWINSSW